MHEKIARLKELLVEIESQNEFIERLQSDLSKAHPESFDGINLPNAIKNEQMELNTLVVLFKAVTANL